MPYNVHDMRLSTDSKSGDDDGGSTKIQSDDNEGGCQREFVRDGDSVITGNYTESLPMSLIFEIIRQGEKRIDLLQPIRIHGCGIHDRRGRRQPYDFGIFNQIRGPGSWRNGGAVSARRKTQGGGLFEFYIQCHARGRSIWVFVHASSSVRRGYGCLPQSAVSWVTGNSA